jgi:hypothetical protein
MKNQKHAVLMSPSEQFEVLQTTQGLALFFPSGPMAFFIAPAKRPAAPTAGR